MDIHSNKKRSHSLTLRAKIKAIAKIKSQCRREQKTCLSKNNLSRGSLSNWCEGDADEDADNDGGSTYWAVYVGFEMC